MDVTFNNVLEGARQYFQGLPTATCTTNNASYPVSGEHQISHYGMEQKQERTSTATLSYWPPHSESQLRPQALDSSHHSDAETARLPAQNQNLTQLQEHHRTSTNYHVLSAHQEQSIPTSHSYPYNQRLHPQQQPQHVSQYQSHIISNPSYHPTPTSHQSQATSSRPHEQQTSQSYHQLQTQTEQSYSNYQQTRSYYPMQTQTQQQPQTYHHSYQVASSQAYPQTQQPSYSNQTYNTHSQNLYATDNTYATIKPTTQHSQEVSAIKDKHAGQNQQTSQPYRTTHNLPPIAALSNVNYHSSRSREAVRSAASKARPAAPTIPTSSYPTKPVTETAAPQHSSRISTHYGDYINSAQQNRPVVSQSYQYSTSIASSQSSNHYTTSTGHVSTPQTIHHQSSNSTTFQNTYVPHQEVKAYHPPQQQVSQNVTHTSTNSGMASVIKQKRESPLDLSVKTVRTSADSTLEDADDAQRLSKYYQASRPPTHSPLQVPVSYPSYVYTNSLQRNLPSKSGAPKVDFLPNFNMPSLSQQIPTNKVDSRHMTYDHSARRAYDKKSVYQQPLLANSVRHSNPIPISAHGNSNPLLTSSLSNNGAVASSVSTPAHNSSSILNALNNSSSIMQASVKKPIQGLPRIDFLPPGKSSVGYGDPVKKRSAEPVPPMIPSKIPKIDMWRQTIDQQIEQKLSSYTKSRLQQEQSQRHSLSNKLVNGNNFAPVTQERNTYQRPQYNSQAYPYNNTQTGHNQTYVPTPVAHHYPGYTNHGSQQPQQALYSQHSMQRTNSNPCLPMTATNKNNIGGAADRRVLSLLRNSLEIKGAKEAKKKLEQEQQPLNHARSDVQQPSTDVMAPLQPKPGVVGRHNMSPFAATSLFEQNTNIPPTYKFHLPKAIDSIKLESEDAKDTRIPEKNLSKSLDGNSTISNTNTDLDGLAAFLAARIRTKAELKQVGSTHNAYQPDPSSELTRSVSESQLCKTLPKQGAEFIIQSGSPSKLAHEQVSNPPRRRLFSKNEGDPVRNAPLRDKTGLRSSSETSVFDFPDSDSETEMPVLERQSLVDMRKDRKTLPKSTVGTGNNDESTVTEQLIPLDNSFDNACDNFMQELKARVTKKRGRRKKVIEPEILAKLEDVTKEKQDNVDTQKDIKEEPKEEVVPKIESDSDSDVPLINCLKTNSEIKKEMLSNSDSESDVETIKNMSEQVKEKQSTETISVKNESVIKKASKGKNDDGSEFYPGWEEEVYNYKRSLRMPAALIHVTRPPHWHRLSTSLPDLDSRPISPSPSENTDAKPKTEPELDSEIDTNSNFSFSFSKNYDSEEGSSSIKNFNISTPKPKSNSILARLIERCGTRKRRKTKKKVEDNLPKIIPKATNEMELLPTPGLEIQTVLKDSKKSELIIKEESAFLGFRKKTIDNFKDAFINNSNSLLGINEQFKTVVMKSRTRLETRALKQKATIKEVFGDDRPASAPPVTCVDNTEQPEGETNKEELTTPSMLEFDNTDILIASAKEALKNKLLGRSRKSGSLLKSIATKKISEYADDDYVIKDDCKSETPSIDGDDYITPAKKRMKNIRRKFSSGFDYIRKKKKQIKKEGTETEPSSKPKRRGLAPKASPESIQDIQKEIKMWVLNKGIGETHLHRAARCGYTDITAYCLEKMEGTASPKDNAGYTPLHEACARGHLAIAKLLLLYGANVSESAQGGIRPLHEAAENGFVEIVRLLLSYGADPLLATYSGLTPLSLATEETTIHLLQNHIADIQGHPSAVWNFLGPASCFDPEESGYNPLDNVPNSDQSSEEEDQEFEISNVMLPNLYTIRGEPQSERWILLQDLSHILKIKSRDTLLKQICPVNVSNSTNTNYKSVMRELKMADFLEQASCCQYLCAGEKVNTRASKVALVKYSDKVRQLLNVEKCMITVR